MLNQNKQESMQQSSSMTPQQNFGGNELLDAHEAISAVVGGLEHFVIFEEQVQDKQLLSIMQRQKTFLTQIYNTIVDTLKSGQDPAVKTQTYTMTENHTVIYGLTPSTPKTPIQSANEVNDECISGSILGQLKGISTNFTSTALESNNPVLRRIFADSIPNVIEMAYEMFLYQNKHKYYQVAQLQQQDMQTIQNTFGPMQGNMTH